MTKEELFAALCAEFPKETIMVEEQLVRFVHTGVASPVRTEYSASVLGNTTTLAYYRSTSMDDALAKIRKDMADKKERAIAALREQAGR